MIYNLYLKIHRIAICTTILFTICSGIGCATPPTPIPFEIEQTSIVTNRTTSPVPSPSKSPKNNSSIPSTGVKKNDTLLVSKEPSKSPLESTLRTIASKYQDMRIGLSVTDISSGEHIEIRGDRAFPMASAFKLPVMIEAARQMQDISSQLDLDTPITITNRTKCIGSGDLASVPSGTAITMAEAIEKMITISDNTATDTILDTIGVRNVNRLLNNLGLKHSNVYLTNRQAWIISLRQGVPQGDSVSSFLKYWTGLNIAQKFALAEKIDKEYANTSLSQIQSWEDKSAINETYEESLSMAAAVDNQGSPNDYNNLLIKLWKRQILNDDWSQYCLDVLALQKYNTRIPALLPKGTKVFHKTGTITGVANDTGIIMAGNRPIAISAFVDSIKKGSDKRANKAIGELSYATYKYFKNK